MRRQLTGVLLMALVSTAAPASAATINFDDIPGTSIRTFDGNRYAAEGVTISTVGGDLFAFNSNDTDTLPTWIYGSTSGGIGADAPLIFDFASPLSSVSVYVYDSPFDVLIGLFSLSIYNAANVLLDSISSTADRQTFAFNRSEGDISRLVFVPSTDLEGIDTLSFSVAEAPEPASVLLLGLASLGMAARRRYRRLRA